MTKRETAEPVLARARERGPDPEAWAVFCQRIAEGKQERIAAEDLPRLAQPFEQVEGQHSKTTQGTGLGLALTRALIELHGGALHIDSQPGRGTTVSFELPSRRIDGGPRLLQDASVETVQSRAA